MYVLLLSAVCIWSSVWEIQTCGSSCAFLLQVLAGPSVEMCMPACGSSQVCGPACASSACAYLVVVIGVGSRGPACTSPVCANRPFGRNVGAGLRQFSNLRPGLHSKFATPLHVRTGLRSISCAPACVRRLSPNIRQYWVQAARTRRACFLLIVRVCIGTLYFR